MESVVLGNERSWGKGLMGTRWARSKLNGAFKRGDGAPRPELMGTAAVLLEDLLPESGRMITVCHTDVCFDMLRSLNS